MHHGTPKQQYLPLKPHPDKQAGGIKLVVHGAGHCYALLRVVVLLLLQQLLLARRKTVKGCFSIAPVPYALQNMQGMMTQRANN